MQDSNVKVAVAPYTYNRLCDLAFRSRVILIDGFAVGLALFQEGYSTPLTHRDADSKLFRITEARQPELHGPSGSERKYLLLRDYCGRQSWT